MRTPGTIEVSEKDYSRLRHAHILMLASLKAIVASTATGFPKALEQARRAIKFAEGDEL